VLLGAQQGEVFLVVLLAFLYSVSRFPNNPEQRAAWTKSISRTSWQPKNWERVCGKHFVSVFSSGDPKDVDYLPTLHIKGHNTTVGTSSARSKRVTRKKLAADVAHVATVCIAIG